MTEAEAAQSWTLGGMNLEYSSTRQAYDELVASPGKIRSHWEPLVRTLDLLGGSEIMARGETARRFLLENGVTYNVYGDSQGFERTWQLDSLPLLIPSGEWAQIEAGLIQRTRLLGRILEDLYSGQSLFERGLIPPSIAFANPAFLRPCRGIRPAGGLPLFLHAVDLARSPDGNWWALADRTQAPSGAGYALVNRIALSRVFPEEFKECNVQRLAGFFQVLRDTLRSLAPQNRDNPNVVLLTPGAYNEAYFEHAYLARYLGFPLVEGGDLTVRDQRVFIKTLEGLRRVDVILRRIDDSWCDPLELRSDSYLGVAGLVEAARAGTVAIANPLGSGVVETPALLAFLPGLCKQLFGEELLLPSAATWWCGQPKEMDYVSDRLDELVIKRAFPNGSGHPSFGRDLDPERREAMLSEIRQFPQGFVGQEQLPLSRAPVVQDGKLVSRSLVLRAYVCATGDGFRVMPGGLTRVSQQANGAVVSTQSGGSSKDTWVLSDGPVSNFSLLKPPPAVVRIERQPSEVPSRVADNFFWLGRYAERLEDTIRLLRVVIARLAGESVAEAPPELNALLQMMHALGWVSSEAGEPGASSKIEKHLLLLIYKSNRPGAVRDVLQRLRQIAFAVRDRFTADTWRIFNKLQMDARVRPGHLPVTESLALLNTLVFDLSAFNGMAMENMTRGHGWLFLDIGRRLERALHMTALLRSALITDPSANLLLDPLLEISDSVMSYRRRYFARPQWSGVMDLLLLDETNPRSVAFQLASLSNHVDNLPTPTGGRPFTREKDLILTATEHLDSGCLLSPEQFAGKTPPASVIEFLESLSFDLVQISDSLTLHYFSHADSRPS